MEAFYNKSFDQMEDFGTLFKQSQNPEKTLLNIQKKSKTYLKMIYPMVDFI